MSKELWVTKGEGFIEKIDEGKFSNNNFVNMISEDTSVIGTMLKSIYSTTTTITLKDPTKIPPTWKKWSSIDIEEEYINKKLKLPAEIPYFDRLWVPKAVQSDRTRDVMSKAGFIISPRGIKDKGEKSNVNDAIISIIYSLYYVIEKSTISSMKNKKIYNLSVDKKASIEEIYSIVKNRGNTVNAMLGNLYVEPSVSTVKYIFILKSIYGSYLANSVVNDFYYRSCRKQVEEIEKLYNHLKNLEVI